MTRGDKSVGVQTFLILEKIAQKFLLKSPLESTHREELKSALRFVLLHLQGGNPPWWCPAGVVVGVAHRGALPPDGLKSPFQAHFAPRACPSHPIGPSQSIG